MMITRNFIGVVVLCLCALAACTSSKESKKTLTVLSWNVWHGGHSKTYSGKGCEGTIDILKKSEADVVLMIETYGAAPMVADSLGYSYNLISDNLSIYSRYPIIRKYAFADSISTFNFGGVMIDVDGKPVRVFNTWLHYLPDMRLVPTDKSKEEILAWEMYNPQIQISAESETKRSIFREKDKTKRSKKESAQHSKSRNKSFVMTSVSAL